MTNRVQTDLEVPPQTLYTEPDNVGSPRGLLNINDAKENPKVDILDGADKEVDLSVAKQEALEK